jgi:uncharacterized protein (DUF1697 family)
MTVYVALLRGINVGGYAKVPMKDLRSMFATAGAEEVQTNLQSGNDVFKAEIDGPDELGDTIAARIETALGLDVAVLIRTHQEMITVAAAHPFLRVGAESKTLHVVFLSDVPESSRLAALAAPAGGDQFQVVGREVYLYLPDGAGKSKLTNTFFEKKLHVAATGRNWNTVTKVAGLCTEMASAS